MTTHTPNTQSALSYSRRLLRLPQVEALTGFKRSHIYNLMKIGTFPKTVKLGLRAVGWDSIAIDQWIHDRLHSTHVDLRSDAIA